MRTALLIAIVAAQYGCSGSAGDPCSVDQDCPSGFCQADHTCAPVEGDGDGGRPDSSLDPDATPGCLPDHDGTITRDELPLQPGRTATYRVAADATIDTAGTIDGTGAHHWSLTAALPGETDRDVALVDPTGQWWAPSFPDASYATSLSAASDLVGVFRLTATRLQLLGVVSPTGGSSRTELAYDPPVDVLTIPLSPSSSWTVDTTITGVAQGVAVYYTEHYDARVDALGTMATPFGDFPVSRVAVDLMRTVGATFVTSRTFAFVAECYSTVATVVSQDYESGSEFTDASEVRRLAP
jgi:hypothetical protein